MLPFVQILFTLEHKSDQRERLRLRTLRKKDNGNLGAFPSVIKPVFNLNIEQWIKII